MFDKAADRGDRELLIGEAPKDHYKIGLNQHGNAYVSYFFKTSKAGEADKFWEIKMSAESLGVDALKWGFTFAECKDIDGNLKEGVQYKSLVEQQYIEKFATKFNEDIFANNAEALNKKILETREAKLNGKYHPLMQDLKTNFATRAEGVSRRQEIEIGDQKYEVGYNQNGGFYLEKIMALDPQGKAEDDNRYSNVLILAADGKNIFGFKQRREKPVAGEEKEGSVGGRGRGAAASAANVAGEAQGAATYEETDITNLKQHEFGAEVFDNITNKLKDPSAAPKSAAAPTLTAQQINLDGVLEALYSPGANIAAINDNLKTAQPYTSQEDIVKLNDILLFAARAGSIDLAKTAIAKGANARDNRYYNNDPSQKNHLHWAIFNKDKAMVEFLLQKGAGIKHKNGDKFDASQMAIETARTATSGRGHEECETILRALILHDLKQQEKKIANVGCL